MERTNKALNLLGTALFAVVVATVCTGALVLDDRVVNRWVIEVTR